LKTQNKNEATLETRPEVVRVFGRNFYINYCSPDFGITDMGLTQFHRSIVNICEGQLPVEEADTLLHEIIHVIDLTMELDLTEKQVTTLAHGLIGVFQDNPDFAKFVTQKHDFT